MPSQRVTFANKAGQQLVGIVDSPAETPVTWALFAHCFTCTKDLKAIVRISRRLAAHGIAVLRFDFTGLGGSQGAFADTNFQTNVDDIHAAVQFLTTHHQPPQLLIGHSLGGAAMMAAASSIESRAALVTLASPSDTSHLAKTLVGLNPELADDERGDVVIGGITHTISRQMLEALRQTVLRPSIEAIRIPHLIFHSPADRTVAFSHALNLLAWSGGPTSLVSLDRSDHLLLKRAGDVDYVADMISLWSTHHIAAP